MFTGLIETMGEVRWLKQVEKSYELAISIDKTAKPMRAGDSLAVNGCCLTIARIQGQLVYFNLLEETLSRTNLKLLRPGGQVNLESALTPNQPMGGHFVQGHVDCQAEVVAYESVKADHRLEVALPANFAQYVCYKGSISINGVSLTVAELLSESFVVWVIPYTHRHTNLSFLKKTHLVNLEFDILAKYIERMLQSRGER